ncbi:MAG TPA: L,D-transpeptidase [Candidatus Saccharimonadales bacterium]|jgi:lipoprotein-anchoring transpeptidase ErfK/SrfK
MIHRTRSLILKASLACAVITGAALASPSQASAASINDLQARCQTNSKTICIVKGEGSRARLYAVKDKEIVAWRSARTGDARPGYATREGTFKVNWKNADHISSIYKVPMPYAMFFSGGQAVHFSSDFLNVGYDGASHGCVNLRDRDFAKWLFKWSPVGTRVVVAD